MARKKQRKSANGAAADPGAVVRVTSGFYEGLEWPVIDGADVVIGRGREADFPLSEPTISRAHAKVAFDGGRLFVQDLGSTNGTLVNGAAQERAYLGDGDVVQMGKLVLRIQVPGT